MFRVFEIITGPTPAPNRFVIEQDRPTTVAALVAVIRATGALAVTVEPVGEPGDLSAKTLEAARLAEQHRATFALHIPATRLRPRFVGETARSAEMPSIEFGVTLKPGYLDDVLGGPATD